MDVSKYKDLNTMLQNMSLYINKEYINYPILYLECKQYGDLHLFMRCLCQMLI